MGLIGFLAQPYPVSPGSRGRHRRKTPSGGTERLTRLLGTLAVAAAAVFGPAVPALAVPAGPTAPGRLHGELPASRTAQDGPGQRTGGHTAPAEARPADAREGAAGGAGGLPDGALVRHVETARTSGTAEQLWLLGGVALSLTAAGIVAVAATRGRRRYH